MLLLGYLFVILSKNNAKFILALLFLLNSSDSLPVSGFCAVLLHTYTSLAFKPVLSAFAFSCGSTDESNCRSRHINAESHFYYMEQVSALCRGAASGSWLLEEPVRGVFSLWVENHCVWLREVNMGFHFDSSTTYQYLSLTYLK